MLRRIYEKCARGVDYPVITVQRRARVDFTSGGQKSCVRCHTGRRRCWNHSHAFSITWSGRAFGRLH